MHTTLGRHLLVEYHGCDAAILNDTTKLEELMKRAASASNATVVQSVSHRFSPQGVTVVLVLEESHLSIHTWPEAGYAAVDFYTCGECDPTDAHRVLFEGLKSESAELALMHRGVRTEANSIQQVKAWFEGRGTERVDPGEEIFT